MSYVDSEMTKLCIRLMECEDRDLRGIYSIAFQMSCLLDTATSMPEEDVHFYRTVIENNLPRTTETLH
jgi:hypothetical protein